VSQLPDPQKKDVVGITDKRQVGEVFQCLNSARGVQLPRSFVPAKYLRDFKVQEMRRVKGLSRREEVFGNARRGRSVEQDLKHR
jgi:hypothetical protein